MAISLSSLLSGLAPRLFFPPGRNARSSITCTTWTRVARASAKKRNARVHATLSAALANYANSLSLSLSLVARLAESFPNACKRTSWSAQLRGTKMQFYPKLLFIFSLPSSHFFFSFFYPLVREPDQRLCNVRGECANQTTLDKAYDAGLPRFAQLERTRSKQGGLGRGRDRLLPTIVGFRWTWRRMRPFVVYTNTYVFVEEFSIVR